MKAANPRGWLRRAIAGLVLCIPFALVFFLGFEIWLRLTTSIPLVSRTRCFTQNKQEAPGFLPSCEETIRNPHESYSFRTNEDGFRDRDRAHFSSGGVALLGDSYVEGFWLNEEAALARSLERQLKWKVPLLNVGIRASGPTQQAIRLFRAWKTVPIRGVIWVLNPSDPIDEILFHARNPNFEMNRENWSELQPTWPQSAAYLRWTRWSLALQDRVYLLLHIAEKWIKQGSQSKLLGQSRFSAEQHCSSLKLVAAELKKSRLPLVFIAIPHGMRETRRPYIGVTVEEKPFEELLVCAKNTGFPVVDLRHELNGQPDWYWPNDWHYNQFGVEKVVQIVAPKINEVWGKKP